MRIVLTYLAILVFFIGGWIALISASPPPERQIIGSWEQTSWEYEKLDLPSYPASLDFMDEVKRSVGEGLIIHKAETWRFLPSERLLLYNGDTVEEARWRMKGRGHILQVVHGNGVTENYVLDKLDQATLQLYVETNIQARGIARLVFSKHDPGT
jgi:hypothetical protein